MAELILANNLSAWIPGYHESLTCWESYVLYTYILQVYDINMTYETQMKD